MLDAFFIKCESCIQQEENCKTVTVILKMKKSDAVKKLKEISDECSNGKITITVDSDYVHFENLDERDRI